jgi:hypothetical protein
VELVEVGHNGGGHQKDDERLHNFIVAPTVARAISPAASAILPTCLRSPGRHDPEGLPHKIAMPFADDAGAEVRVVAHGKVVAAGDHFLAGLREQLLPMALETEGVIALTKDGE